MEIIPFDQRDGFIWFNGKIIPWQDAKIHVMTHGLHYASCVWEGIRTYSGHIFKLDEHIRRWHKSAEILDFTIPYSAEELSKATKEIVAAQKLQDGYIKPIAWRGSEKMAASAMHNTIHVAIICWPMPDYYKERQKGIRLMFADWVRPAPNMAPTASKAAGLYMISTLSKHKAERLGYHDALLLDYRGYIAEATVANFFMVIGDELHTPIADCFLNGITRQTVIELARARGIKVSERHIKPEELANASEVFLTGTASEITPVVEIDKYNYAIGNISQLMIKDYKDLINATIKNETSNAK